MVFRSRRTGFSLIEGLVIIGILGALMALLLPAVQKVRHSSYRVKCTNHLKQLGLALHQYHGANGVFPRGQTANDPREPYRYLGWQPRLLPFMEREELWRQTVDAFQSEPSAFRNPPHVGLSTVIPLFTCPVDARVEVAQTTRGTLVAFTCYLGVEGLDLASRDGVLFRDSRVRLTDVSDGTSGPSLEV
jgi:type II secretory pathway pseudopilin PulG